MRIVKKEFTVKLNNGKVVTAEFESEWVHDPEGTDSDGNRTRDMDFMIDLYTTVGPDDASWQIDDEGNTMTKSEVEEAEKLLYEKAESDSWDEAFEWNDGF